MAIRIPSLFCVILLVLLPAIDSLPVRSTLSSGSGKRDKGKSLPVIVSQYSSVRSSKTGQHVQEGDVLPTNVESSDPPADEGQEKTIAASESGNKDASWTDQGHKVDKLRENNTEGATHRQSHGAVDDREPANSQSGSVASAGKDDSLKPDESSEQPVVTKTKHSESPIQDASKKGDGEQGEPLQVDPRPPSDSSKATGKLDLTSNDDVNDDFTTALPRESGDDNTSEQETNEKQPTPVESDTGATINGDEESTVEKGGKTAKESTTIDDGNEPIVDPKGTVVSDQNDSSNAEGRAKNKTESQLGHVDIDEVKESEGAGVNASNADLLEEDRSFKEEFNLATSQHSSAPSALESVFDRSKPTIVESDVDSGEKDRTNESVRLEREDKKREKEKVKEKLLEKEKVLGKPWPKDKESKLMSKLPKPPMNDDPVQEYEASSRKRRSNSESDPAERQTESKLANRGEGETQPIVTLLPDNYPVVLPSGEPTLSDQAVTESTVPKTGDDEAAPVIITLLPNNYPVVLPSGESTLSDKVRRNTN